MEIRSLTDGGKLARRTLARHQDTGYCIQNQVTGRMERQRLAHPALGSSEHDRRRAAQHGGDHQ
jgi:hypothetical protein